MSKPDMLTASLFPEMFQTERSAQMHCRREAERLAAGPAAAMLAASAHADASLPELTKLAEARGHKAATVGLAVGQAFSEARDKVADMLVSAETSYRGTLLGMRHGVDLLTLAAQSAANEGDAELAAFCAAWLERRKVIVEEAAAQLCWFAKHPEAAREHHAPGFLSSWLNKEKSDA